MSSISGEVDTVGGGEVRGLKRRFEAKRCGCLDTTGHEVTSSVSCGTVEAYVRRLVDQYSRMSS